MVIDTLASGGSAGAPWWGVTVIAGAFAIGGAAVTSLISFMSDRRKAVSEAIVAARNEASATTKAIRTATARLLVESRTFYENYKLNFALDNEKRAYPIPGPPLQLEPVHEAYWNLVFVATPAVDAAAWRLWRATRRFNNFDPMTRELNPLARDEWRPARQEYFASRAALVNVVKQDKGREWTDDADKDA